MLACRCVGDSCSAACDVYWSGHNRDSRSSSGFKGGTRLSRYHNLVSWKISPHSEIFMIQGVLVAHSLGARFFEEVAQLRSSSDCFTKVKGNIRGHLDCFSANHVCEMQKILDGKMRVVLARSTTCQPGDNGSCILLVAKVDVEKTGGDAVISWESMHAVQHA